MTQRDLETIRQIKAAAQGTDKIPASQVKTWLCDAPVDVLGALTGLILKHSRRIEPPLNMQEICDAILEYYKQCLQGKTQGEFVPPKHIAGRELVRWFRSLWNDPSVPRVHLQDIKMMLAEVFRGSDEHEADMLVNAILEHLFETAEIAEFFADWKTDSQLKKAFARAMEWVEKAPDEPGR
jgi:hypothetical protein